MADDFFSRFAGDRRWRARRAAAEAGGRSDRRRADAGRACGRARRRRATAIGAADRRRRSAPAAGRLGGGARRRGRRSFSISSPAAAAIRRIGADRLTARAAAHDTLRHTDARSARLDGRAPASDKREQERIDGHPSPLTVNGKAVTGEVEPRTLARPVPARAPRPHRHACRLRHQPVRRLRRPCRRLLGQELHHAGGAGRRREGHDHRGPAPTATSCIRCRRPSASITACNAASARRAW